MAGEWIAILAVFSFVISNVLFRRTEKEASPIFINFIRTAIGTITFLILSLIYQIFFAIFLLPLELWILLCLSFLFGQVIGDTSYFQAQKRLGTTLTLAVSMTFPLFTFIFSLIFLNRPFEISLVFSLIFISVGIIIISKTRISSERSESYNSQKETKNLLSTTSFKAIIFALIAAVTWAIGLVMIDFATNEINESLNIEGLSSVIGNLIRFPFALLILLSMVLTERIYYNKGKITPLQKKTQKTWAFLIIASIIGTSLGAYLYTEAARTAGAAVMSLIASASPLFSLPLTYWVNKEKITKYGFLGVLLTIIGVILAVV